MTQKHRLSYNSTIKASFAAYVVQAIVNNFAPLLFLTFQSLYGIPLSQITLLITFNFCIQLLIDALSARFIDKIGYRASIVTAHACSAAGLVLLAVLPDILPNPFAGLLISVMIYAVGGGLIEVLVSPIVEACPTDNKETAMSLLHSFYCWGHVAVVLVSTVFFALFGIENWKVVAVVWALVPAANCILFTQVPIASLLEEGEKGLSFGELLRHLGFLAIPASDDLRQGQRAGRQPVGFNLRGVRPARNQEHGRSRGPMFFAILMGTSRALYGKYGERLKLDTCMRASAALCIVSYLIISLSPWPFLSLLGCGICGFSVGILWPGSFSIASRTIARGGTLLFALLALGGDVGCSLGPTFVGMMSSLAQGSLSVGILAAVTFPVLMLTGCLALPLMLKKKSGRAAGVPRTEM